MQVAFTRRPDNGTVAEFARPDGVRVRLNSYDRTGLVPHDAAHLIVERAFRLEHGVWGCLAAGGLFPSADVVEGRTKHDHRARSAALLKAHDRDLHLAEMLVGATLSTLEDGERELPARVGAAWELYRGPAPRELARAGADALAGLRELQSNWVRLRAGQTFELQWPTRPRAGRK